MRVDFFDAKDGKKLAIHNLNSVPSLTDKVILNRQLYIVVNRIWILNVIGGVGDGEYCQVFLHPTT